MIVIQTGMKQEEIIKLLDKKTYENISFEFTEKKGISLYFSTNNEDEDIVIKLVKNIIKSQEWGKILYFNVLYM